MFVFVCVVCLCVSVCMYVCVCVLVYATQMLHSYVEFEHWEHQNTGATVC